MYAIAFDAASSVWTRVDDAPRNQPARDFFAAPRELVQFAAGNLFR